MKRFETWKEPSLQLLIQNLSKTYPNGVKALSRVSLKIGQGMFGLLGPNGAGKSTLMRILATLQEPDRGTVRLDGLDVLKQKEEVRSKLDYLPQEFGVYPRISAEEMLDYLATLKGISPAKIRKEIVGAMLKRCNLYEHRKKSLTGFSGGMRQRFGIAQALIGDPQLLIVDEPTAGLDPGERNRFYDLLSEIGEEKIVILSTHIVKDVTDLCTNMAILHEGKVLYEGKPEKAMGLLKGRVWKKFVSKDEMDRYDGKHRIISSRLIEGKRFLHVYNRNSPGKGFAKTRPDLEDVFFSKIRGWS